MLAREIKIIRNYLQNPAGSVLIETGKTKIVCSVSVESGVPAFLQRSDPPQGWLTAEYNMLPCATSTRYPRERGRIAGRTAEIQRLIGRSLRAVVDLTVLAGYTVTVDCDVIQADGGTRTTAVNGGCIALHDAFSKMLNEGQLAQNPLIEMVAAVSTGYVDGELVIDLCYEEDSRADVDLNLVMTESGNIVEIQGTAEKATFDQQQLLKMIDLARDAIAEIIKIQKSALAVLI